MIIAANDSVRYNIRIRADLIADTLAEVMQVLESNIDKYIQIVDQDDKLFYVEKSRPDRPALLKPAYENTNYDVVLEDLGEDQTYYISSPTYITEIGKYYFRVDTSANEVLIELPDVLEAKGRIYDYKKISSDLNDVVFVAKSGSGTLLEDTNELRIKFKNSSVSLRSTGTEWEIRR